MKDIQIEVRKAKFFRRKSFLIPAVFLLVLVAFLLSLLRPDISDAELLPIYAPDPSRFLEVKGVRVHYRDEGRGPVLLLVHGTFSSLHTWEGWTQKLKNRFRIVRLDIPGHGLTGHAPGEDYTIQGYISFLDAFANALHLNRFHLAGNSLGGLIAWNYTVAHPGKVDRLILIDSAGFRRGSPPPIFLLARSVLGSYLRYATPEFLVRWNLKSVYGNPALAKDETLKRYYDLVRRQGNRDAFMKRLEQIQFTDTSSLTGIKNRTLILWGAKDPWINPSMARDFLKAIKNSHLILYPDAGHVPMEEIPDQTAEDAEVFLTAP